MGLLTFRSHQSRKSWSRTIVGANVRTWEIRVAVGHSMGWKGACFACLDQLEEAQVDSDRVIRTRQIHRRSLGTARRNRRNCYGSNRHLGLDVRGCVVRILGLENDKYELCVDRSSGWTYSCYSSFPAVNGFDRNYCTWKLKVCQSVYSFEWTARTWSASIRRTATRCGAFGSRSKTADCVKWTFESRSAGIRSIRIGWDAVSIENYIKEIRVVLMTLPS
jgi:hypothetical protein